MRLRIFSSVFVFFCMTMLSFGQQKMNAAKGDGLAVLKEIAFETGTIEVELLGENRS